MTTARSQDMQHIAEHPKSFEVQVWDPTSDAPYSRRFGWSEFGGRDGALAAAKGYRDNLLQLPAFSRGSRQSTGVGSAAKTLPDTRQVDLGGFVLAEGVSLHFVGGVPVWRVSLLLSGATYVHNISVRRAGWERGYHTAAREAASLLGRRAPDSITAPPMPEGLLTPRPATPALPVPVAAASHKPRQTQPRQPEQHNLL